MMKTKIHIIVVAHFVNITQGSFCCMSTKNKRIKLGSFIGVLAVAIRISSFCPHCNKPARNAVLLSSRDCVRCDNSGHVTAAPAAESLYFQRTGQTTVNSTNINTKRENIVRNKSIFHSLHLAPSYTG